MLIANKYEFPDECPQDCPERDESFYQGNTCSRCPIFNCRTDDTGFCLIEPENYREDWAAEFYAYLKDYTKIPKLRLINNEEALLYYKELSQLQERLISSIIEQKNYEKGEHRYHSHQMEINHLNHEIAILKGG